MRLLIRHKGVRSILRRYLVTNGFDGTLTMLGLMSGFYAASNVSAKVALSASLGAAIALFVSGVTSAYLSEAAERQRELRELEEALLTQLDESEQARAARGIPYLVALVNGLSPLLFSLLIISPVWLVAYGIPLPVSPFLLSIIIALGCIFALGVYLGTISGTFWLLAGARALLVAGITFGVILVLG